MTKTAIFEPLATEGPPDAFVMSHSDSEIPRGKYRKPPNLHIELKAKNLRKCLHGRRSRRIKDAFLLTGVATNNTERVREQLKLGADPNTKDHHGRSALHIAASKGYTEVVEILLDQGADPNQNDILRNTPLHLAACTCNLSIISLLLKAGADVTKMDLYGKNPLQLAKSKLQLLQKGWTEGFIEMTQIRTELQMVSGL